VKFPTGGIAREPITLAFSSSDLGRSGWIPEPTVLVAICKRNVASLVWMEEVLIYA